jgi:PAS domain S-box-containing protein
LADGWCKDQESVVATPVGFGSVLSKKCSKWRALRSKGLVPSAAATGAIGIANNVDFVPNMDHARMALLLRGGWHMLQSRSEKVRLRLASVQTTSLRPRAIWLAVAVGIAYFLAAELSLALLAKSRGLTMFWLAGGISSGVLIALGHNARLPVASGTIIATIIASLMGGRNIWISTALALCNVGEALCAAWLIERHFGAGFSLNRLRNVLGLLAAAVITSAAGALGGAAAYKLLQGLTAPIWTIWQHWFASGSIGFITVAPLMIGSAEALRAPPRRNDIIEGVIALVALTAMEVVILSVAPDPWEPVASVALLFPILLWLGARCQPVFAAAAALIVSLTILWTIAFGVGHFGDPDRPIDDRILNAQAAILGFTLCAYVLAALFAERREAEARLQEALAAGGVMAFECKPHGEIHCSENAAQILGLDSRQVFTSTQFVKRIHPDDLAQFEAHRRRVRADSRADSAIFRFIRPDGREVWLEETARAEFETTGRLICIKGLTRDVTERKHAEERQNLLTAELDHRVKNVLARVAAVARQTQRRIGTITEFVKALDGRIESIAATHALLSESRWSGVGLIDLIRDQLAPYTTETNSAISGPDVILTSAEAQAVAMVMHELVTNAAKYGALSRPDGRVVVTWDRANPNASALLKITWRELGGPPIAGPVQPGYGSNLIRDLVPHELGGVVDLTFASDGLCCKIEIPLRASWPVTNAIGD